MLSPTNNADHGAFLHRAAHDAAFRAALMADPQPALAEYGLSVAPEQIPSEVTIPTAESILDTLIDAEDGDDSQRYRPWMWPIAG